MAYRSVLLKLSGEALGDGGKGLDRHAIDTISAQIAEVQRTGTRLAAASITMRTISLRCSNERYANSPVLPKGARPCTPHRIKCSTRSRSTRSRTRPADSSIGETR